MKKAFSTVELSIVLVILTVLTVITVAKINVNNASSIDIKGFSALKMAVDKESSLYLINNELSTYSELNSKLSDLTAVTGSSTNDTDLSYVSQDSVAGFAVKVSNFCYMLRKDYAGSEPQEVWSIAESGDCSGSRALSTTLVSGRGETSSMPAVLG